MGGLAFSSGKEALYTPRMPASVYHHMRDKCHAALLEIFADVSTPVEGPDKQDFGDIDILVAIEKKPLENDDGTRGASTKELLAMIQRALQAERAIFNGPDASVNLAIAWPAEFTTDDDGTVITAQAIGEDGMVEAGDLQPRFIQVDVRVCDSLQRMQWIAFKHAHGDIWNLLGSTIRPFGLTADETGLFIRIPEIETHNRKLARVFMTNDTGEVLRFLGLEASGYWDKPFDTIDDLFEYAASCKFFWVKPEIEEREDEDNHGAARLTDVVGQEIGEGGKMKLKSNDRRRMNQRPVFRKWIDEFIPQCRAQGRFLATDPEMTKEMVRAQVRDDAFTCFPGVKEEYQTRLIEWMREKSKTTALAAIKAIVPEDLEPQRRGNLITALKKIIFMDDESFGIVPEQSLKSPDGMYLVENIRSWVAENWQGVYEMAWQKQLERAREGMALKQKKKEQKEIEDKVEEQASVTGS